MTQLLGPQAYAALAAQLGTPPENYPGALYVVASDGRVVFCNQVFARLTGAPAEALLGKPSLMLYPPEATPAVLMERAQALAAGAAPRKMRTAIRRRNGGVLPVELQPSVLRTSGEALAFAVRAHPLLRLTQEEADALPCGLIVLDSSGVVIGYNAAESRLSRIDRDRVVGRNFFADIAPCTGVQDFAGVYQQMVATGYPERAQFDFLFRFRHGDRPVSITMAYFPRLEQGILLVEPKAIDLNQKGTPGAR